MFKYFVLLSLLGIFAQIFGLPLSRKNKEEIEFDYTRCKIPGVVAITFDDGPYQYTEDVLNLLSELNVTATFFISNVWWDLNDNETQMVIRRAVAEGHTIGCHTWTHPDLVTLSPEEIILEITQLSDTLVSLNIIPELPQFFRPPFGSYDKVVFENVLNYTMVNWSIDTWDWSHPGDIDSGMKEYWLALNNGTAPEETMGFVALHHDVQFGARELARTAIEYVRSMGYKLVSIEECLGID